MFAEELSSNAAHKRAAEARNRRRQLKQKQQQKQKDKAKANQNNHSSSLSFLNTSSGTSLNTATASATTNSFAATDAASATVAASSTTVTAATTTTTTTIATKDDNTIHNSVDSEKDTTNNAMTKPINSTLVSFDTTTTTIDATSSSSHASKLTAVEIASQQRRERAHAKLQHTHATKIQSSFRAYKTFQQTIKHQRQSFDAKISDLTTLVDILKQRANSASESTSLSSSSSPSPPPPLYIPPPATSTELTTQFLFFANDQKLEYPDVPRLNSLLRLVLLPSLHAKDEHMQVIKVWIQSKAGQRRLETMIHVCINHLATWTHEYELHNNINNNISNNNNKNNNKNNNNNNDNSYGKKDSLYPVVFQYLSTLFSISGGEVGTYIQNLLYDSKKIALISKLRWVLSGGAGTGADGGNASIPIPPQAEGPQSFSKQERTRMNLFLELVLNTVLKDGTTSTITTTHSSIYSQFFVEILTVPLLTWKVDVSILVKPQSRSAAAATKKNENEPILPLLLFISQFRHCNDAFLSEGLPLEDILPAVALNKCPAPSTLCLLANLVQLGRCCDAVNGLNLNLFDWKAATEYFDLLSILLNQVPLGTFTHRAAVEWILTKSTHSPVLLSPVVIEQCRLLLLDSWVRSLFNLAIDDDILDTDAVMQKKTEKDLKYEKEMMGGENAMALAAKEATHERGEGILWQSSKWAKKLGKTMNNIFAGNNSSKNSSDGFPKGQGQLVNTSAIAKQLAHGNNNIAAMRPNPPISVVPGIKQNSQAEVRRSNLGSYTVFFFYSLCRTYGTILSRWGGGGGSDIANHKNQGNNTKNVQKATTKPEPCALALLNVLSFSTNIVRTSWGILQSKKDILNELKSITDPDSSGSSVRSLEIHPTFSPSKQYINKGMGPLILFMFLSSLSHTLLITDDIEIHDDKPIPRHQLRRCILLLKDLLYRACFMDIVTGNINTNTNSSHLGLSLISASSKTMRDLYDRSSRRPLCLPKRWLIDDLLSQELSKCKTHQDYTSLLQLPVLTICPYFVPFQRRLLLFNHIVTTNRVTIQGSNINHDLRPGIVVSISRSRILEDGLMSLNSLGRNALRQRLVISFMNEAGVRETGVDAGGLLKEFWCDLSALAFDPNYALFKTTEMEQGGYLYPNPSSSMAHGSDHITLFAFLGRILGKALYEGITIQPQFAHSFLSFMRGDYNYMHMLSDLSTLDPVLYNNLMFLKNYDGDASDLALSFTVANNDFGGNKEVALIPNGERIDVTNLNKQKYISLMAKYHVCDRLRVQAEAFTRGLWDVIDPTWLRLFNEPELQVLISGSTTGKLDIADMKAHCKYVGGYTSLDRNIHRFWKVVSSMTPKQQAALLKFVTSCERPPASGFKTMTPPFTIQRVWIMSDGDRLPTASTCFNILKLPTYSSEKVLRKRLLYSIEAGAGFELT